MEFRQREIETPTPELRAPDPPFIFMDENGKEIRIPMETFRQLPEDRKRDLFNKQMQGNIKQEREAGRYPAHPGYAITAVVENCMPEDLANVATVQKTCPAKMKMHQDYRLSQNVYIARYFILNGNEQREIEDHWLSHVPTVQFSVELENGLTEVHRRSLIDGPEGERLETTPMSLPSNIPNNAHGFNPTNDMSGLAKPCANCKKKQRQEAQMMPAGAGMMGTGFPPKGNMPPMPPMPPMPAGAGPKGTAN